MKSFLILAGLFLNSPQAFGLPEIPSVVRDVHIVEGGELTYPHIPPHRTSMDG